MNHHRVLSFSRPPLQACCRWLFRLILAAGTLAVTGCPDMSEQPKALPLRASRFFPNGASARPLVLGTVPRGHHGVVRDAYFPVAPISAQPPTAFPFPLTRADLARGREQFDIFCAPCHGRTGDGNGMIVQRGFTRPPSYHIPRLQQAPVGHFYEVITKGYGAMYSYNDRIGEPDRWRIVAWVRVLQLSQNIPLADLSLEERRHLQPPP